MAASACPLCACERLEESWLSLKHEGQMFRYLECARCGSLICSPMPDESTLRKMYDLTYCHFGEDVGEPPAAGKFDEVLRTLGTMTPGTFLDFGCGDGSLLLEVQAHGWKVIGVDLNPEFSKTAQEQGVQVFGADEQVIEKADVIHIADVLEHLTCMERQFPQILRMLKPGGYVIAHGPLEGNPNTFFKLVRLLKRIRGNPVTMMAPFHVILATTNGQRMLFKKAGLFEERFTVSEIAFPAPETLKPTDLFHIRNLVLFAARRLSQAVGRRKRFTEMGNRYFYVGRLNRADPGISAGS